MTHKFRLKKQVILKGDNDLFIAYDVGTGNIIEVNASAFAILSYCEQPRTVASVARMLCSRFKAAPVIDKVTKDSTNILKVFRIQGILETV